MGHGGQRCTPIRNRTCVERRRQAQIVAELLAHRSADVLERFGFVWAARADDSGKNSLIGVIERAAVEYPLCVTTLRRIIEQRGEAARNVDRWRVFQVDGVDRFVFEACCRFVNRFQCIVVSNDVMQMERGGRIDHCIDLNHSRGLVTQVQMKAIFSLDAVDSLNSDIAANLARVRHHVALYRLGKQR